MQSAEANPGPIMRLFEVWPKPGCADALLQKFATTSADVVQNEPGNEGYFLGQSVAAAEDVVIFASMWKDLNAIKDRFGETWQTSFLPPGYEDLIEECTVRHFDVSSGWHVALDRLA